MLSSRREKSLTRLCQKFLSFYPPNVGPNQQIIVYLDRMVQFLEVERRRIYDIVNVLESVEVLSRHSKNQYLWHGFNQISHTLSKLKTLSIKTNFLEYVKKLMASQLDLHDDIRQAENVSSETMGIRTSDSRRGQKKDACTQTFNVSREEKSLGIMCQKFLMLFLTSEDGVVSINFAARVLLGDAKNDITEHGRFKTKIRRLYDIANVLVSIGLIRKYQSTNVTKPAYLFIGPPTNVIREAECVSDFLNFENPHSKSKHSLFDHFKRRLNLESKIPNFDLHTGTLNPKDDVVIKEEKCLNNAANNDDMYIAADPVADDYNPYYSKDLVVAAAATTTDYGATSTFSESTIQLDHHAGSSSSSSTSQLSGGGGNMCACSGCAGMYDYINTTATATAAAITTDDCALTMASNPSSTAAAALVYNPIITTTTTTTETTMYYNNDDLAAPTGATYAWVQLPSFTSTFLN